LGLLPKRNKADRNPVVQSLTVEKGASSHSLPFPLAACEQPNHKKTRGRAPLCRDAFSR